MDPNCCSTGTPTSDSPASLPRPARWARGVAGLAFLALAWVVPWPVAIVAVWFGVAHLVASLTGYVGCPELGAIPSVVLRKHVSTRCGPWDRVDRWLARRRAAPSGGR